MADTKITALAAITVVDPAADVLPIVDISDTSMAASGTTKKITSNQILGSGGTATLASATITGDLTVDTNVLKVDTTNNLVGIGTASPNSYPVAPNLVVETATGGGITIRTSATSYGGLFFADGTGADSYRGYVQYNHDYLGVVDKLLLGVAGSDRLTINSTGDVNVVTGNVVMGTSGKGIDFSATTSGSGTMTSELLNDYEEGTWVGTLTGGTTTPATPQQATGKYTKIGRQVSITIYFQNVDTTGYSGAVAITGLPFTEDGSRANGTAACYNFDFNSGTAVFVNVGVTTLYYTSMLTNSNWRDVNHSAGAGRYLQANVIYYV